MTREKNKVNNFCKNCEAWCCYDGVYLTEEDELKIKDVVEHNKEYFKFLPDNYVIDGNWENVISGRKTNVKPKIYKTKGFPKHFNQTTCVFCVNNKCMLQEFAVKNNEPAWKYKPFPCCVFPLQKRDKIYYAPSAVGDDCDIGAKYPGYVSFLPCYKLKKEDLKSEFEHTKNS